MNLKRTSAISIALLAFTIGSAGVANAEPINELEILNAPSASSETSPVAFSSIADDIFSCTIHPKSFWCRH